MSSSWKRGVADERFVLTPTLFCPGSWQWPTTPSAMPTGHCAVTSAFWPSCPCCSMRMTLGMTLLTG